MNTYSHEAIQKILGLLDPVAVLQLIDYRPETIQVTDAHVKSFCPIHKEQVFRTLFIERRDKRFRCSFALCPGSRAGNLIRLYALAKGLAEDEAARQLIEAFGFTVDLPTVDDFVERTLKVARNFLDMEVAAEAEAAFRKVIEADANNLAAHRGLLAALAMAGKAAEAQGQRLEVARLAKEENNLQTAREALEAYLAEAPDDETRRCELIEAYRALGLEEEQIAQYMTLAERLEAAGRVDEALEMYRAIDELHLGVVDVFPHVVQLMKAAGRRSDAVAQHLRRADDLERRGLREEALACINDALDIDPERAEVRWHAIEMAARGPLDAAALALALKWVDGYMERQSYNEALEGLRQLEGGAPGDERILDRTIQILQAQGKTSEVESLYLRMVDERLARGDFDGALKRLETLLQSRPDSPDLLLRKADLLERVGRTELARRAYAQCLEALRRDRLWAKAVEVHDKALALQPDSLDLREERLQALNELGETQAAVDACLDLADRYLDRDEAERALRKIEMAIELAPESAALHQRRARVAERLGRRDEATQSRLRAAECLMAAENYAAAAAVLEETWKAGIEEPETLFRLAACEEQLGETGRAIKHLDELARLWEKREAWDRCEAVLRHSLEVDPANVEARERLADVMGRLGRTAEEVALLQEAAERLLAESTYSRAEGLCQRILARRPDHAPALEMLVRVNEAAQKAQAVQDLLLRLADIYKAREDHAAERKAYERILEKWPETIAARRRYALLLWDLQDLLRMKEEARRLFASLLRTRRFDEAAADLAQLQRLAPDEPLFLELAALLYEKWAKPEEWAAAVRALADLYRRRGLYSEAAEWTTRLLERFPRDEALRADLISLLLKDERADEAARQYAQLARLHIERAAWDDAIAAYQAALELNPSYAEGMMALVRLYFQKQDYEAAVNQIHTLAEFHEHQEQYDEAIATLRLAFEVDRESVDVRKRIIDLLKLKGAVAEAATELDSLRTVYEAREDWDSAIATLRDKAMLQPEDRAPRAQLVDTLRRRGRSQERFAEELGLAEFHLRQQDAPAALAVLDRLVEEDRNSLRARRMRAEALALSGDDKKALSEFLEMSREMETSVPVRSMEAPAASAPAPALRVVPEYVFDAFVVGSRNNFAYATALAVAKSPGQQYNPLFLYSDVGMGKTHLLHAIANYTLEHHPQLTVLYTSADEFTTELVDAIENNTVKSFRARHKATDLFLLDDVQFLAGKERAQEEFFHIFNTLFQAGRQIVVSSDRPPKALAHLEKRLASRFGAGVTVDIQAPDVETRIAILQREIKLVEDATLPDWVATQLAQQLESNVRELKGALNQVVALVRLAEGAPSEEALREIVERVLQTV
ncbi:MAG: DnaA/Hda family protein [Candidatus Sumerlaeota bacterium]|nr:DnaA/Hda family protein [Candidatus Sumerlaeota bacterium]